MKVICTFCAIIFPFPKPIKAHKVVLNSTRPLNTHPLTFLRGSGHKKITWIAFIWPLSTARSHFHFSDDWSLLEMSVGERLCSRVSDRPAPPLAAFGRQGQIIAHFLGRSYDLHIYYGIFCTGCSVGGRQRPISPQVWTKAWQRYFQCRQCSLLSSLVIQIPMVTAMGGWVSNLGLFPKKQIGGGGCACVAYLTYFCTHKNDTWWIQFG